MPDVTPPATSVVTPPGASKGVVVPSLRSLVSLQVITTTDKAAIKGNLQQPKVDFKFDGRPANAIVTCVNIATGDITNVVPEEFWAPEQKEIRDFHLAQVKEAHAIIAQNAKLIAEYGRKLAAGIKALRDADESNK